MSGTQTNFKHREPREIDNSPSETVPMIYNTSNEIEHEKINRFCNSVDQRSMTKDLNEQSTFDLLEYPIPQVNARPKLT